MDEVKFTHRDILDLTAKLGDLMPGLTEDENKLLLAIFATAASHITEGTTERILPAAEVRSDMPGGETKLMSIANPQGTPPEYFQRALLNAYLPGEGRDHPTFNITIDAAPPGPPFTPRPQRPKPQPKPRPKPDGKGDQPGAP